MIYNDYTNDEIIKIVKEYIENTINIPYDKLLKTSKTIKNIYSKYTTDTEFNIRYKEIYYNNEIPNNISEKFIKRMSILNNLCYEVEKGDKAFYNMALSLSLAHLINWELIDITLFWNLDQATNNNKFMTDLDYQIYDYYCLLTFMFFEISETLKKEFNEHFEDKKIKTYTKEIIQIAEKLN